MKRLIFLVTDLIIMKFQIWSNPTPQKMLLYALFTIRLHCMQYHNNSNHTKNEPNPYVSLGI